MSVLKIEENDFLWRYYQKSFVICDEPVRPPANFCEYFWTGMYGVLASVMMEKPLWMSWLLGAIVFGFGVGFCTLGNHWDSATLKLFGVLTTVGTFFYASACCCTTHVRLQGFWQKVYDGALLVFGGGGLCYGFGAALAIMYNDLSRNGVFDSPLAFVQFFGLLLLLLLIPIALLAGLTAFAIYVLEPLATTRFVKAVLLMLSSWKRQVCPMIEPPETFMARMESSKSV